MALRGVGQGPLLVVHGLGDRAAAWRRFAAAMPAGRDVVTFDLPGHGGSPPANDYRYPALVEAVGRAAAGYHRFALLGHSVGGAVAWLYAASYPERVTRLVLVEPAAPHRSRFLAGPRPRPAIPTPTPIWRRRSGRSPPSTRPRPKRSFAKAIGSGRTAAGSLLSTRPSSRRWSTTRERMASGTGRSWDGSGPRRWWCAPAEA